MIRKILEPVNFARTILGIGVAVILLSFVFIGMGTNKAKANLSRIQGPVGCSTQGTSATSLSTSSVSYMTAGTGTTTATCNMMIAGLGTEVFDSALLEIQFVGSSTASTLRVDILDSTGGIDFYSRSLGWNIDNSGAASSTPDIGNVQSFNLTFASSTQNRGVVTAATGATTTRNILLPVTTTFIKAIFYLPPGSAPGAVWARWVGKTQIAD